MTKKKFNRIDIGVNNAQKPTINLVSKNTIEYSKIKPPNAEIMAHPTLEEKQREIISKYKNGNSQKPKAKIKQKLESIEPETKICLEINSSSLLIVLSRAKVFLFKEKE